MNRNLFIDHKRKIEVLIRILLICIFCLWGCQRGGDQWTEVKKEHWMRQCDEFVDKERRAEGKLLKDVCDCLLVKVVAKYTPEEADTLDLSNNREMLEECHYFD